MFMDGLFEEPQRVLDSRLSKIQMPVSKVMNKVPDGVLQRIFKDHKEYLPVALNHNSQRRKDMASSILSNTSANSNGDPNTKQALSLKE
mmetsp:Transcript_8120/g.11269  ORF Transcript_8120/g.11269 Transcript_8120/m.11269 type:complete len:89 (-) Transcript_8120:37-303(-)